MKNLISFIGFGEAAFHIANGLKTEGLKNIAAYDINQNDEKSGQIIRKRAEEAEIQLLGSIEEAYSSAKYIVSLTSAKVAHKVAESIIPNLVSGQIFVDMNSAAPTVKSGIGKIKRAEGVYVCDAAVMNTVPGNAHKVQMYLSGDGAESFYNDLVKYRMNLEVLKSPLGGASAIKMFRSVIMKGLPQLMFEAMYPAMKYDALDALVKSVNGSLEGKTLEDLANIFIARTMVHAARRAKEMDNVILTLESMGLDASMSRSTKKKLEQLAEADYIDIIGPEGNMDYKDAIKLLKINGEDK